ncbi:hypothetical protein LguiB_017099 [Lonicera macranthoides]
MGTTTTINQSIPSQTRRVSHTPTNSPSSSNYGGGGSKPLKKRTIDGDNKLKGDYLGKLSVPRLILFAVVLTVGHQRFVRHAR